MSSVSLPRNGRPPARPAPRARSRRTITTGHRHAPIALATSSLTVVALISLWVLVQLLLLSNFSHERSQDLLYSRYRQQLAEATAPTGGLIAPGSPVALLSIPRMSLQQVVVEGTASGDLLGGPGHLRTTPLPGQAGVSVVMGKALTYGAPFKRLSSLQAGDSIEVQNAQGLVRYTVADIRRAGDPIPSAPTGSAGRLTLVSAESTGAFDAMRAGQAVYVDAVTRNALPDGGTPSGTLPAPEQVMARDTTALPVLVMQLAFLLALAYGVSAARVRFSAALVWVLAAPLTIALSWSTTDVVTRLLPNLM